MYDEIRRRCNGKQQRTRRGRRSVQLPDWCVLPTTPSVEWPRHIEKGRKVRCWLGGQLLFFWGDFSCCINPQISDRKWRGDCRVSLWGDD